ncbi:uncharacterized protein B4U80_00056, partial [Leptotrombidium deliense]
MSKHRFQKNGPLKNVWIDRNPPGYAFYAADVARALGGSKIDGSRVNVEISHGRTRNRG